MRLMRARTTRRPMRVDDEGLHFERLLRVARRVHGRPPGLVLSTDEHRTVLTMHWPKRLRRLLEGTADVRIATGDDVLFEDTVVFGEGEGRPSFVDPHGIPIFVDKWGLIQRPFSDAARPGSSTRWSRPPARC